MDCVPELAVTKRKTVSSAKMAKRLRRFVRDNQPLDAPPEAEDFNDEADRSTRPAELLCRIPEETLFQLQQIYEALEDSNGDVGSGGGGNRRKSAPGASSLRGLIASSASVSGGDHGGDGETDGGVQIPVKLSKKRSRGGEDDVPPEPVTDSKATSRTAEATSPRKKKKKARRKSNAT